MPDRTQPEADTHLHRPLELACSRIRKYDPLGHLANYNEAPIV